MSEAKIPLDTLKERVKPLAQSRFSKMLRDFINDVAEGMYPRELAKDMANKATVQYSHQSDAEFVQCIQWLAVIAEQYGSGTAKQVVKEILK